MAAAPVPVPHEKSGCGWPLQVPGPAKLLLTEISTTSADQEYIDPGELILPTKGLDWPAVELCVCFANTAEPREEPSRVHRRSHLGLVRKPLEGYDNIVRWMGDAGGFWSTACYAMDLAAFSAKWCRDIRDAQRSHGVYQDIAPEVPGLPRTVYWLP